MPQTIPSGKQWMSTLEGLYILRPSVVHRQGDYRYLAGSAHVIIAWIFFGSRFTIGALYPDVGMALANYFNVLGTAGRLMSFAVGMFVWLLLYFRIRLLIQREIPFFYELMAYDDERKKTILSGEYKERLQKFFKIVLLVLKFTSINTIVTATTVVYGCGLVAPLAILGVTWKNILKWGTGIVVITMPCYYFAMDWVYVFGSWFLCKSHLDMQADVVTDMMAFLLHTQDQTIKDSDVIYIQFRYNRLVKRVREFDILSRDLISPYRLVMSYAVGLGIFAVHKQENLAVQIVFDAYHGSFYIVSLIFLFSACSLSIRRRAMYELANQLFVKVSRERSTTSLKQLLVLRQLVKSLGNDNRPTLCLNDKSGEEFEPMEFVEFVLDTFANFSLAANLYHNYVK